MFKKQVTTKQVDEKDSLDRLRPYLEKWFTRLEEALTFISNAYHALQESSLFVELRSSVKFIIWVLVIGYALKGGARLFIEASSLGWDVALKEFLNTSSEGILYFLPLVISFFGFFLGVRAAIIVLKRWHEYSPLSSGEHYLLIGQLSNCGPTPKQ